MLLTEFGPLFLKSLFSCTFSSFASCVRNPFWLRSHDMFKRYRKWLCWHLIKFANMNLRGILLVLKCGNPPGEIKNSKNYYLELRKMDDFVILNLLCKRSQKVCCRSLICFIVNAIYKLYMELLLTNSKHFWMFQCSALIKMEQNVLFHHIPDVVVHLFRGKVLLSVA